MSNSRPVRVGEPLAFQIENYLKRLRRTVPFPCTVEDCYYGMFPPTFKQWIKVDGLGDASMKVKVGNVMLTVHRADKNEQIHLNVETQPEEMVFWLRGLDGVPAPENSATNPLRLDKKHPHHRELVSWLKTAYALEGDITHVCEYMRKLEREGVSTSVLRGLWPELMNFVKVPLRVNYGTEGFTPPKPQLKKMAETMLATSVMLPEQPAPLYAWVGYATGKEV